VHLPASGTEGLAPASSSGESGANSQTRLSQSMMTSALGLFPGRCGVEVSVPIVAATPFSSEGNRRTVRYPSDIVADAFLTGFFEVFGHGSGELPCLQRRFPAASCPLPKQAPGHRGWMRCACRQLVLRP
jgi:hypothetical protein